MESVTTALFLSLLLTQDAGSVLRTSVGYNTMKASLPLSTEQRTEADRLLGEARKASTGGNFAEATRLLHRGMAVMQGAAWNATTEFAASLEARADHAIVRAGQPIQLSVTPLYPPDSTAKLTGSVYLMTETGAGGGTPIATKLTLDAAKLGALPITLPAGTAAGNYFLETRLAPVDGEADPKARTAFTKRLPVRVADLAVDLAAEAKRLDDRLAKARKRHPLAEYTSELYARADRGEVNPHRYDFAQEFAAAHRVLDAVDAGGHPFAGVKGDLRMAYRSEVDNTLQPYRLYVPTNYDGQKALPLVVALHGMGGDENSIFDQYAKGQFKREAEKMGWLIVCPKGRESASMYMGKAQTDVLDVLADVQRQYKVDARRVYLMGHSMGGYGTWNLAMARPELFAALGPVAGGGNPGGMEKIKHIPQFVVHGDSDKTVPVGMSRVMVEAGKKVGATITYVEVPGGNHVDIVVPNIAGMFEFFAKQARAE